MDSPINGPGCSSEILKRTPQRNQHPVLWAGIFLLSVRRNNSNTAHPLYYPFPLNTLKGSEKNPAIKDMTSQSGLFFFYMEVPRGFRVSLLIVKLLPLISASASAHALMLSVIPSMMLLVK